MFYWRIFILLVLSVLSTRCESEEVKTPYSFHYTAGRFPGHTDRYQAETGDGQTVRGTYTYIDPKFKIRTVDYTADKNGFHPILTNFEDVQAQPKDSEAVKLAKWRHFDLYQRIASGTAASSLPKDSLSVAKAKDRHLELYRKIAAEHEAIVAARKDTEQPLEQI